MRSGALALALLSLACGEASLSGADALSPATVPSGKLVAVLAPFDCVDGAAGPVPRPDTEIRVIVREDQRPLLIEARPGYDSLVVHNVFQDEKALTFQAISSPSTGAAALHEYRVDWPGARSGRLSSSLAFEIGEAHRGRFRAVATGAALLCRLGPKGGSAELDTGTSVR